MQTAAVLFSCSYVYLSDSDAGHQGSTLSDPRKTTGFGPFKLPTRGPLQKGRDHSPPKACFEEPSTRKILFLLLLLLLLFFFFLSTYGIEFTRGLCTSSNPMW